MRRFSKNLGVTLKFHTEDPQTKCIRPRFVHYWSWVLTKTTKIDSGLGFESMVSRIRITTTTWWRLHKLAVSQTNYVRQEPKSESRLKTFYFRPVSVEPFRTFLHNKPSTLLARGNRSPDPQDTRTDLCLLLRLKMSRWLSGSRACVCTWRCEPCGEADINLAGATVCFRWWDAIWDCDVTHSRGVSC